MPNIHPILHKILTPFQIELLLYHTLPVMPFLYIWHVFYANIFGETLISFATPQNLCYNNSHDGTENIPKNTMFDIHTNPTPLGHLFRRVLRLGDHRNSLRRAGTLCKPFFCHHLRSQTSSFAGISLRPWYRRTRDAVCCQEPQRKTTVTLRKANRVTSFFRQSTFRSACTSRSVFGAWNTLAQSLRYHNH